MSESLRNDGRIWVPKKIEDAKALQAGTKKPTDIPDEDRDSLPGTSLPLHLVTSYLVT